LAPDLALYLARQGLQQGPLPGSTPPATVGYALPSEPESEENPLAHHVPTADSVPTWLETSRSTVYTIAIKLDGQPPVRVAPTSAAANAAGSASQFTAQRMRLVIGHNTRGVSLASARITGEHVAHKDSRGQLARDMPCDLGSPEWPRWAAEIANKIMTDIERRTAMGRDGKEDEGTKDAREGLEKMVKEEEGKQGQ
jgi:hypothetical protein